MVAQIQPRMTVADFDAWLQQPENDGHNYEFIGGEIYPVVSNNYCSQIAARILVFLGMYLLKHHLGYVTGADGGYIVQGERYIPDVGFISKARQPQPSHDTYNPNPPDLAVEVLSPTDSQRALMVKVSNYVAAGATVWVVYPDTQQVDVHQPQKAVQQLTLNDTLTGGDLLPNFKLPVKDIFPPQDDDENATEKA